MKSIKLSLFTLLTALSLMGVGYAQDAAKERIAALKANMASSKATLSHYEWIQTTVVSLNGDVKSTKQERCYYGADGTLQKVELSDETAPSGGGGMFRRLKERKKQEMTDYMKQAVALVKTYVPPNGARIQAAKDRGNMSLEQLGSGRIRLDFTNYQLPGDTYKIELNMATSQPLGLKVGTYLNDPSDVVQLGVVMGQLDNGATYASKITLNAVNKGLTVTVQNSGYRRIN